ncbi:MAG TPA: hypothetical protein VFW53_12430 [Gallionella sp.]|nr:hypothetical protein [Gallionella sp.]
MQSLSSCKNQSTFLLEEKHMKKIVLSLAGVMAAVAFAPEASAVPVFARQTGMACSACHFQHFPLLNGFGRAFKSAGFTMMGAQGKIEGEHLSIPNQLNMSILATAFYQDETNSTLAGAAGNGRWGVPGANGELSLFAGGKVSDFAGFLTEIGAVGPAALAAAKMPILFEVAESTRAGVVPFTTGNQGAGYSFETLNTGAVGGVHRLMGNAGPTLQHGRATSANMFLGGGRVAATGLSAVVNNDRGFLNIAKYEIAGPGAAAARLPLTYIRAAGFFDVAGWDMGAGIQNFSGSTIAVPAAVGVATSVKATVIDFQAQGEAASMPMGIYASYGTAPAAAVGSYNMLNPTATNVKANAAVPAATAALGNPNKASSFNVAAEFGVLPGLATVQVGLRQAKLGDAAASKDNAFMLGATYELAQNVELAFNYTSQSGSAWSNQVNPIGKNAYTLLLETMF